MIAGIGDCILASRAFRAMRNAYPDAEIHLITSRDAVPLARHYPYLDTIWEFPIREIRKRKRFLIAMLHIMLRIRKIHFDMAVNLHPVASLRGALQMGLLFSFVNALVKIGHDYRFFRAVVNKKIPDALFRNRHYADVYLDVAVIAGGKPDDVGIEVFSDPAGVKRWHDILGEKSESDRHPFIGINPGGDQPRKRLPPKRFAAVADALIEQYAARIVILGAPDEVSISNTIQIALKNNAVNLAGKLTLDALVYVIGRLDLLITNDSAPMHIAAARGIKQVAIFGPGYPVRFRPYTDQKNYVLLYKELACRPCNNKPCDHIACINTITVDEVVAAVQSLLNGK